MKINLLTECLERDIQKGLTKSTIDIVIVDGEAYVVKSKNTFVVESEDAADELIENGRTDPGFIGCDKKYNQGKVNKAGEITKPETWSVTIKCNQ